MAENKDINIGRVILGEYKITSVFAKSNLATVYKATNISTGEFFAVKTLNTSDHNLNDLFEKSALKQKVLSHPNIVKTIDIYKAHSGKVFQITEYVNGVSLEEVLESAGNLSEEAEICDLVNDICQALICAHNNNLIHGNLRPSNVFLVEIDEMLVVKVSDFTMNSVISAFQSKGTINSSYQSPETVDFNNVSRTSDLYSLAKIAYQTICGKQPQIDSPHSMVSISDQGQNIKCSEILDELMKRAFKLIPGEKENSVESFQNDFNNWYEQTKNIEIKTSHELSKEELKSELKQSVHDIVTLRKTQHTQEETIAMKISHIAASGARQSPVKTIRRIVINTVATISITGLLVYFFITYAEQIKTVWVKTSIKIGSMQEKEKVLKPANDNKLALQKRAKATKSSANSPLIKSAKTKPPQKFNKKSRYYFKELPAEKLVKKQPYHPPPGRKYSGFKNNMR